MKAVNRKLWLKILNMERTYVVVVSLRRNCRCPPWSGSLVVLSFFSIKSHCGGWVSFRCRPGQVVDEGETHKRSQMALRWLGLRLRQ